MNMIKTIAMIVMKTYVNVSQALLVLLLTACTISPPIPSAIQPSDSQVGKPSLAATQSRQVSASLPSPTQTPIPLITTNVSPPPSPVSLGVPTWLERGQMLDAVFLPDGSSLVVGWASGVSLIRVDSGKEAWYAPGLSSLIKVDVDSQGKSAAAVFADGSLMVVDMTSGQAKIYPSNVKEYGTWGTLAWSPDGKTIAFQLRGTYRNDPIYLLEVASGQISQVPNTDTIRPNMPALIWSPDGKAIAMGSVGSDCPRVINVASGQDLMNLGTPNHCQVKEIAGWLPNGSGIAAIDPEGNLELLSFPGGSVLKIFTGPNLSNVPDSNGEIVSFSSDGQWMAGYYDITYFGSQPMQTVTVWDTTSGQVVAKYDHPIEGDGLAHRLSAIFTGDSLQMVYSDGSVTRWDFLRGNAEKQLFQIPFLSAIPYTLRWSQDGSRLTNAYSVQGNALQLGGVVVWDATGGQAVTQIPGAYDSPALDATGSRLALVDRQKGQQEVADLASGRTLFTEPGTSVLGGSAFSPDGKYLAYSQGQSAALLDLTTGKNRTLVPSIEGTPFQGDSVTYLIWSPDSQALVVASGLKSDLTGKLVLWQQDAEGNFHEAIVEENAYAGYDLWPYTAVFNPSGNRVAIQKMPVSPDLSGTPEVVVYDLRQHAVIQDQQGFFAEQWVNDQTLMVKEAAGFDDLVSLDVASGQTVTGTAVVSGGPERLAPGAQYYGVINSPEGNSVDLYDWQSNTLLGRAVLGSQVDDFFWSPDGHWLAVVGHDGSIRLWSVMFTSIK